jgi:glycosyltransferase involved in cell wall biosynthesis
MTSRKKICICSTQIPFATGGTEFLVDSLVTQLRKRDHVVDVVRLPLQTHPHEDLLKSCLAWRLTELNHSELEKIDLVIATRFPSYMVRQQNKVVWLVHQHRQIYDLYGTPFTNFQPTSKENEIRRYMIELDQQAFLESRKLFAISRTVAERLRKFNGFQADVLYPPITDSNEFFFDSLGDFVLSVSRLAGNKRIHLLIEAMQYVPEQFHAVLVGDGHAVTELKALAEKLQVQHRIHFLGHISRGEVIQQYAKAGVVFYGPMDEDYGFATLEAFHARKPVITCNDSGGVLEFVDASTGWITEANPELIANSIKQALGNKNESKSKGEEGHRKVAHLNWDFVLDRLLSEDQS